MIETTVLRVIQHWPQGAIGVVLKEKTGERRFVFFVDHAVGTAIIHGLASLPSPRPQTHDLLVATVAALKASVRHVAITDWKEGMFFAQVNMTANGETHDLDARPSDAWPWRRDCACRSWSTMIS